MGLLLASCSDDYTDWANPQSNAAGTVISFGTGSVSSVGVIDFNVIPDTVTEVQVCSFTAPTVSDTTYHGTYYILFGDKSFMIDTDGMMSAYSLQNYVITNYGYAPVQRDLRAKLYYLISDGVTSKEIYSDEFTVSVVPEAPIISSAYYYIGTSNGWTPYEATYQLDNGGGDVYANPVFTVVVPAVYGTDGSRQDNWFKIYSQETMEVEESNFWKADFIGYHENGANDMSGTFVEGRNDSIAFSFKIPGSLEADKYRLTFNMLEGTFTIECLKELGTPDLWYLVGECIGDGQWGNSEGNVGVGLIPLYPATDNYSVLNYVGYFPAGKGFKLIHNPGSWDEQWGMNDGVLVKNDGGSGNITVSEDGYYLISYDMDADVVTISRYTGSVGNYSAIYMPGAYQGWDAAGNPMTAMSSVVENHDWYVNATYSEATELKFAANGSWDINWGDTAFPVGVGTNGGPNIPVAAGTYLVIFNDILGEYYFIEK